MGLIVDFKDNLMTWDNVVVAMKTYPKKPPLPNEPLIVSHMILDLVEDNLITMDKCLSSDILQSKYEPWNIRQIAQGQKQLTPSQRNELEEILLKFPKLFSGGLGKFNGKKIHLDLDLQCRQWHHMHMLCQKDTSASSDRNSIASFKRVF
jgi:hypothetical protein